MKVDLGYFIVCLMKGQSMGGTGSNIDVELLKELSKFKPLDSGDFHPLQKRESQHLQQTHKVKTERNPIKGI